MKFATPICAWVSSNRYFAILYNGRKILSKCCPRAVVEHVGSQNTNGARSVSTNSKCCLAIDERSHDASLGKIATLNMVKTKSAVECSNKCGACGGHDSLVVIPRSVAWYFSSFKKTSSETCLINNNCTGNDRTKRCERSNTCAPDHWLSADTGEYPPCSFVF